MQLLAYVERRLPQQPGLDESSQLSQVQQVACPRELAEPGGNDGLIQNSPSKGLQSQQRVVNSVGVKSVPTRQRVVNSVGTQKRTSPTESGQLCW